MKLRRNKEKNQLNALLGTVVNNVMTSNPALAKDLVGLMTMFAGCDDVAELLEHVIALAASEFPGYDRELMRQVALQPGKIDPDRTKDTQCSTIKSVAKHGDGWSISTKEMWCFHAGLAPDGYEPKVGSEVWQYVVGCSIYGTIIDGHIFFYTTDAQKRAKMEADIQKRRNEERARFPEYDERLAKLPQIFQD